SLYLLSPLLPICLLPTEMPLQGEENVRDDETEPDPRVRLLRMRAAGERPGAVQRRRLDEQPGRNPGRRQRTLPDVRAGQPVVLRTDRHRPLGAALCLHPHRARAVGELAWVVRWLGGEVVEDRPR